VASRVVTASTGTAADVNVAREWLGRRLRRLRTVRRLRARSRLRRANARSVARALATAPHEPQPRPARTAAGDVVFGPPRTLLFVTVKRDNTSWRSLYGHWWVEVDDVRSYGWWPSTVPLRVRDLLRGTNGVLNGVGLLGLRGSWTCDPNHGQTAMHSFHPVLDDDASDDEVRDRLAAFAHGYRSHWRWHWSQRRSSGTCRSFQDELLDAAGLREPPGLLHTRGSGCPFLYQPRRVWWSALDAINQQLLRVRTRRYASG
jgi:hypothetical protein